MGRKFIDYKITGWRRNYLKDDTDMSKIIEELKDGKDDYTDDQFEESEYLYDTEQFMTLLENEGEATIEIYDDAEVLWDNTIKN